MQFKELKIRVPWPEIHGSAHWKRFLPTPGNAIFTLVMIGLLIAAQSVGALPLGRPSSAPVTTSTGTIAYQGRLADSASSPLTGTYNMIFRLYNAASGGTPLWEEQWIGPNAVQVSDGLFNIMLGSLTLIPQAVIADHDQLFLGITVGTDDEMVPRVQLGSVPFAVQALTVPEGSVTTTKIADGTVTSAKLARSMARITPTGGVSMPAANTWYEVLSTSVDLSRETLVTIHASVAPQNNSAEALFITRVLVDGDTVIQGEKLNSTGLGDTIMMSTSLVLGAGQHQIRVHALSWQENGAINGDARTQLVVIEG